VITSTSTLEINQVIWMVAIRRHNPASINPPVERVRIVVVPKEDESSLWVVDDNGRDFSVDRERLFMTWTEAARFVTNEIENGRM